MTFKIKELPEEERPREKYKRNGFERLSDADLIAIMLRTGTKEMSVKDLAIYLLKTLGGLKGIESTSLEQLSKIKGIGEVKAITLLTSIELGMRALKENPKKTKRIQTAESLYEIYKPKLEHYTQEHFIAVFLNSKNEIISDSTIFIGTSNKSIVHPRDIYKKAMKEAAVKLIVLHNHPSGDSTPSKEDIAFTKRLVAAGELLQIPLLEHLIIGKGNYYSFYDHLMK